jgi:hypothetical protein
MIDMEDTRVEWELGIPPGFTSLVKSGLRFEAASSKNLIS